MSTMRWFTGPISYVWLSEAGDRFILNGRKGDITVHFGWGTPHATVVVYEYGKERLQKQIKRDSRAFQRLGRVLDRFYAPLFEESQWRAHQG